MNYRFDSKKTENQNSNRLHDFYIRIFLYYYLKYCFLIKPNWNSNLYNRYEKDVWTEIAKFLDGISLVKLAMTSKWFHRLIMEDSIWKFVTLRDLLVPAPQHVAFKWFHLYASAFGMYTIIASSTIYMLYFHVSIISRFLISFRRWESLFQVPPAREAYWWELISVFIFKLHYLINLFTIFCCDGKKKIRLDENWCIFHGFFSSTTHREDKLFTKNLKWRWCEEDVEV